ncbi:MAG: TIGR04282 family arsenosugar biosynthesis glycosyltransferase [Deferrisomatales bacterium]
MRRLIVFAKEPRPGHVKTRLAAFVGPEPAARLYRAFLEDLAAVFASLRGTRVEWWVDGRPGAMGFLRGPWGRPYRQGAGDLGERLARAFRSAFHRGGGPVAVVGTDCPLLEAAHLHELFDALAQGAEASVLPAEDGGYAALGLAAPCPAVFRDIPWSTASVLAHTLDVLEGEGRRVQVLPAVYDVDDRRDLERLTRDLAARPGRAPSTARTLTRLAAAPPAGGP